MGEEVENEDERTSLCPFVQACPLFARPPHCWPHRATAPCSLILLLPLSLLSPVKHNDRPKNFLYRKREISHSGYKKKKNV